MSDEESVATSGGEDVTLYKCRECPGQRFTAPERDAHRLVHRHERGTARGTRARGRASSPTRSDATLFQEVVEQEDGNREEVVTPREKRGKMKPSASPAAKKRKQEAEAKESRRKRRSVKHYDQNTMDNKTKSKGA